MAVATSQAPVIDPTKNVLDLVAAESRYRDAMRIADARYQNDMLRAEIKRIDDLRLQRIEFERRQLEALSKQVKDNAILVMQQTDRRDAMLNERLARLEQFRYESSGKGSGASVVISYIAMFISVAVAIAALLLKH